MTSNNPKDWGDGKMKSAYGLKKNEKLTQLSAGKKQLRK